MRFKIWHARRQARLLSRHSQITIIARVQGAHVGCIRVGTFRRGEEV